MNAKIMYSVSTEKRKDRITIIGGIYTARMVEENLVELYFDWNTEEKNDMMYIEFEDGMQTRSFIRELFQKEECDITNKKVKVVFDDSSYYSDDEDDDLRKRLEEDDWDNEDDDEDDIESVDEDIIAEGYEEYHGQYSGIISKDYDKKENKKFGLLGKKGKYDL